MIKKVIPIFMFIFSIFLIGNNKVKAYESTININKTVSEYTEKFNSINGKYSNVNDNIKYFLQNSGWQKYGKYIFIDYDEKDMYAYVTDDYENFNIVGYYESYTGKNRFTYHFDYSKSKCSFFSEYSQTSPYNTYESFILTTGIFEFEENRKNTGIITNMPSVKLYASVVNFTDKTFNPDDVFISGNSTYDTVIGENTPVIPTLKIDFLESKYNNDVFLYNKYRLSVENFNDDYVYYMGKMSEENSDMTSYNKYSEFYYENKYFRVLYGKENQMHLNNDKTYFDFILNKNDTIIVEVRDKENNYITSMTYTVTSIDETEKVLPYITTDEASTCKVTYKGKDYITCKTYTINAHFSDLTSYYLYLSTDNGETFNKVDTNYGVYTFSGKNNNENFIFKVLDKDGNYITSASYTITGISNYDDIKTFVYINVDETIGYDDELNYYYGSVYYWIYNWDSSYKLYYREDNCPKNDDKYRIYPLSHSDSLYGIGYKYTRDLYACFVVYDKDDNYLYSMTHSFYMENVYQNNNSAFYKFLDKWWTNISAPFTVFKQFVEIIKSLDYSPTSTMAPSFTVDFSYFGVEKSQSIIDFTWYLKYRDTIFNFIYLVFGFITGVKVIHNLRHVFGGGS